MNLLVGATGFIGYHLVDYLFQQGEISKGVFRMGSHLKAMDAAGVQGIEADLLDHHSLHEALEGVDSVYNLASPMPYADDEFRRLNTEGLNNLLQVSSESGVKVFVHLSTIDVFGFKAGTIGASTEVRPSNEYQKAKAEAEKILEEFAAKGGLPKVLVVRAAKALGSRDESIALPILRMAASGRVQVPPGKSMSFVHPKDVAQAMYKGATGPAKSGSIYMVKSFDATASEVAVSIVSELGRDVDVRKEGMFGASAFSKYAAEQLRASLSIGEQATWQELGYVPAYTLKSTAEDIVSWYKKEPWVVEGN